MLRWFGSQAGDSWRGANSCVQCFTHMVPTGASLGWPLPQTALKAMYWSLVRPCGMQPALRADASK